MSEQTQQTQQVEQTQQTQSTQNAYKESRISTSGNQLLEYPHYWATTRSIHDIINEFNDLPNDTKLFDKIESVIGRIVLKRSSGKNLCFYTLTVDNVNFQLMSDANSYQDKESFKQIHSLLNRGDVIGARGYIYKSRVGELSIVPSEIKLLSPCLHMLPHTHFGLEDKELRYGNRHLDLMLDQNIRNIFIKRHKIINYLRNYLTDRNFIEVETPVLSGMVGGAAAKPFVTHHNALKQNMFMRISPELFLKKCVIGGLNKVFEIGKQFRNEGISKVHNPEFTSIELYQVGTDYNELMNMTEHLLENMSLSVNGSYLTNWFGNEINLHGPYQRLDMMDTLEQQIRIKLNDETFILPDINAETATATEEYRQLMIKLNVDIGLPHTLNRLVDGLVGEFVEPLCVQPTFLINHPQIMSPLAKPHRSILGKTERFELFIGKKEFCNAYTELNNPLIQKSIFEEITKQKTDGDDEIPPSDYDFVEALEYGLPPTGGWGLGIDRLVMLLTEQDSIREVILFPTKK